MLRGIGELHLEIVCDTLKERFKLPVTTGSAYVAYRESLDADFVLDEDSFTYDRTVGAKRMFAQVQFGVTVGGAEALEEPSFGTDKAVKATLTAEEFHALQDALRSALSRGPRGFPVVGLNIQVLSVVRDTDTTPGAIRACVAMFVDKLLRGVSRRVLEPLMTMELELPPQFAGDVLNDLTVRRRAEVGEVNSLDANRHTISATVPLATILGYASTLRSMTQGEGSFTVEYCRHSPIYDEGLMLNTV
jgi:elongation factor G